MKKWWVIALLALLLTGCGSKEVMETVADEWVVPVMAQPLQITVDLPGEAAIPVSETDSGRLYLCQDYEIAMQTLSAGDLNATVQTLSGYEKDQLTLVQTQSGDAKRYDFVWVSAGENGERLGRGVILDDGQYHYCMSVLRDAEAVSQVVWRDVFASFELI